MTKQEIFNKVWEHYAVNKYPLGRTPNESLYKFMSTGCPVGILLPNELYKEEMEGTSFLFVCKQFPDVADYFGQDNLWFLLKLQEVHDICNTLEEFINELEQIATCYNLTISANV